MRLTILFEDLDDKDEFGRACVICQDELDNTERHGAPPLDETDFHRAHIAAREIADSTDIHQDFTKYGYYGQGSVMGTYKDVMSQHGYVAQYLGNPMSLCWIKLPVEDATRQFSNETNESLANLARAQKRTAQKQARKQPFKEDLDDTDEFGMSCSYLGCDQRPDREEFHAAHEAARHIAMSATNAFPYQTYEGSYASQIEGYKKEHKGNKQYWDNFVAAMAKQGYKLGTGELRMFGFIKEDLDDKDEFGYPVIAAGYHDGSEEHHRYVIVFEDGSRLYAHTLPSNAGGDYFEKFRDQQGVLHDEHANIDEYRHATIEEYRQAVSAHATYYKSFTPEIWADWKKAFGAIKEDLDDKDEFGAPCGYCEDYGRNVANIDRFHEAHEYAEETAHKVIYNQKQFSSEFNGIMREQGYTRYDRGPWTEVKK